jgi:hypothetical protein
VPRFYNKRDSTRALRRLNDFSNYDYLAVSKDRSWLQLAENVDFPFFNRAIGCPFPLAMQEDIYPEILRDDAICMFRNRPALGRIPDDSEQMAVVTKTSQGRELIVFRSVARASADS